MEGGEGELDIMDAIAYLERGELTTMEFQGFYSLCVIVEGRIDSEVEITVTTNDGTARGKYNKPMLLLMPSFSNLSRLVTCIIYCIRVCDSCPFNFMNFGTGKIYN